MKTYNCADHYFDTMQEALDYAALLYKQGGVMATITVQEYSPYVSQEHLNRAFQRPRPPPNLQITDAEILALGRKIATTYAHRSDPTYHSYAFLPHQLVAFVRELLKEKL